MYKCNLLTCCTSIVTRLIVAALMLIMPISLYMQRDHETGSKPEILEATKVILTLVNISDQISLIWHEDLTSSLEVAITKIVFDMA